MVVPCLFPEIYELILSHLPVVTGCSGSVVSDMVSVRTLVACSRTSKSASLRAVSLLSYIWRPHYLARWAHSELPLQLYAAIDHDYRHLYVDRIRKDRRAVELLEKIMKSRKEWHECSMVLVNELGYDVWDVLAAMKLPIPTNFSRVRTPTKDWYAKNNWIDEVRMRCSRD
jgi:hypothetical protein